MSSAGKGGAKRRMWWKKTITTPDPRQRGHEGTDKGVE